MSGCTCAPERAHVCACICSPLPLCMQPLSACMPVNLPVCLSVWPVVCLPVCPWVCRRLSVCNRVRLPASAIAPPCVCACARVCAHVVLNKLHYAPSLQHLHLSTSINGSKSRWTSNVVQNHQRNTARTLRCHLHRCSQIE